MRISILVLLLLPLVAHADDWTTGEKVAEGSFLALQLVDYGQTRYIAHHKNYHESCNQLILGRHPSIGRVNNWFLANTVFQITVANLLPHKWRHLWIGLGIGQELYVTRRNLTYGIKIDLP